MLSALFRSQKPASWVLFYLIAFPLLAQIFFHPFPVSNKSEFISPIEQILFGKLTNVFVQQLILLLSILMLAHIANKLVFRYKLMSSSSIFPALMVIICGFLLLPTLQWDPLIIATILIALINARLFSIKQQGSGIRHIFNTGLFIGMASLLYFPLCVFLLPVWFTMFLWGHFSFREWLICISSFTLPYFLLFTGLLWANQLSYDLLHHFEITFHWISLQDLDTAQLIRWIAWALLQSVSLLVFVLNAGRKAIETRSNYTTAFWIFAFSFFIAVSNSAHFMVFAWLSVFAGSVFISDFFINLRVKSSQIIFILVYLLALSGQYLTFVLK